MADTDYTGIDKLKHIGVCFLAAIVHPLLAVLLAIGKEYYDSHTAGNHWCYWDLLADAIGTALGSVAWYYLWYIVMASS